MRARAPAVVVAGLVMILAAPALGQPAVEQAAVEQAAVEQPAVEPPAVEQANVPTRADAPADPSDEADPVDEADEGPEVDRWSSPRRTGDATLIRLVLVVGLALAVGSFLFRRLGSGGTLGGGTLGGSTYYLFWVVVPMLAAAALAQPLVLLVAALGLLGRRWLPDPVAYLRHARRAERLTATVEENPADVVAHRALAEIWVERHRPARAMPHLDAARARDPDDRALAMLAARAQAQAGRHADAAAAFAAISAAEPRYDFGAAWLAEADARIALAAWPAADAALTQFLRVQHSSLEGHVKLAQVRARLGDAGGAARERRAARQLYRELPSFQRRRQRFWYLRAIVGW
ncbi:MAG: hypothetical protein R3B06_08660 [Kofleriaceae bacterium]